MVFLNVALLVVTAVALTCNFQCNICHLKDGTQYITPNVPLIVRASKEFDIRRRERGKGRSISRLVVACHTDCKS